MRVGIVRVCARVRAAAAGPPVWKNRSPKLHCTRTIRRFGRPRFFFLIHFILGANTVGDKAKNDRSASDKEWPIGLTPIARIIRLGQPDKQKLIVSCAVLRWIRLFSHTHTLLRLLIWPPGSAWPWLLRPALSAWTQPRVYGTQRGPTRFSFSHAICITALLF